MPGPDPHAVLDAMMDRLGASYKALEIPEDPEQTADVPVKIQSTFSISPEVEVRMTMEVRVIGSEWPDGPAKIEKSTIPPPDIIRTLRCSASHLPMDDRYFLATFSGRVEDDERNITISCAPWKKATPEQATANLNAIVALALALDCQRVLFDDDGPELRDFPLFEEEEDNPEC